MAISRKKRKQRAKKQYMLAQKAIKKYKTLENAKEIEFYNKNIALIAHGARKHDEHPYTVLWFASILDKMKTHEIEYLVAYYNPHGYGAILDNYKEALNNVYLERLLDLDSVT